PPDHVNTSLSSGLGEVVETMMAKDRDARYRTPDDLILDLESLLRGEPPKISTPRADALSVLAEGEDDAFDDAAPAPLARRPAGAAAQAPSPAVVVLSVLLAASVLLNVVQFLTRR